MLWPTRRNGSQCFSGHSPSFGGVHALRVAALPALHRDPFDRMLIAQALCEPMRLLTADAQMFAYEHACGVMIDRVGG
jgi:hypothetical protein